MRVLVQYQIVKTCSIWVDASSQEEAVARAEGNSLEYLEDDAWQTSKVEAKNFTVIRVNPHDKT